MTTVRRRRGASPMDIMDPSSSYNLPTYPSGENDRSQRHSPESPDFSFSVSSRSGSVLEAMEGGRPAGPSFQEEILEAYGVHVPFFDGTLEEAQQLAQEDIQYVVLYLHCPTHEDTADFVQDVLADDAVIAQFAESAVLVGCSVLTPEGDALARRLQLTTYPALVVLFKRRVILTLAGRFPTAEDVLQEWRVCRDMWDGAVAEEVSFRAERHAREEARLREERHAADIEERDRQLLDQLEREAAERAAQEAEAEKAAAAEAAKALAAAAAAAKEAEEAAAREAARERSRSAALARLPDEPPADDPATPVVRISLRSLSGKTCERRFRQEEPVDYLLWWAQSLEDNAGEELHLVMGFPPARVEWEEGKTRFVDVPRMCPRSAVIARRAAAPPSSPSASSPSSPS